MASKAEMFHEGERLISPTHVLPCIPVSIGQTKTIDSQHTEEEMSYVFPAADTNLHGGGDVGEREALEVGEQAGGDGRLLRAHGCRWNYKDAKKRFKITNAVIYLFCIAQQDI